MTRWCKPHVAREMWRAIARNPQTSPNTNWVELVLFEGQLSLILEVGHIFLARPLSTSGRLLGDACMQGVISDLDRSSATSVFLFPSTSRHFRSQPSALSQTRDIAVSCPDDNCNNGLRGFEGAMERGRGSRWRPPQLERLPKLAHGLFPS